MDKPQECTFWAELAFIDADEQFDAGEFSGGREPENEPCGECCTCEDYENDAMLDALNAIGDDHTKATVRP